MTAWWANGRATAATGEPVPRHGEPRPWGYQTVAVVAGCEDGVRLGWTNLVEGVT